MGRGILLVNVEHNRLSRNKELQLEKNRLWAKRNAYQSTAVEVRMSRFISSNVQKLALFSFYGDFNPAANGSSTKSRF